jgi:hypothetical protein
MSLVSDSWIPGLTQSGPPPWANNPEKTNSLVANSVAELRKMSVAPADRSRANVVLLTGEFNAYDGQLQGWYLGMPVTTCAENGSTNIINNDGTVLWRKLS